MPPSMPARLCVLSKDGLSVENAHNFKTFNNFSLSYIYTNILAKPYVKFFKIITLPMFLKGIYRIFEIDVEMAQYFPSQTFTKVINNSNNNSNNVTI